MALSYVEAETGEEIISFIRLGRRFVYVRDRMTKRFIRMIRGIMVDAAVVFDYPKGKHGNPLYVDIKVSTLVPPEKIEEMSDIEQSLETEAKKIIDGYFGSNVKERAKVVGYEHKAEPEIEVGIPPHTEYVTEMYPNAHWYLVWHHYRGDEKEEDGRIVI